ncbi:MAG: ribonuclease III [Patescibacteria group bacterium]
MTLSQLQKTIGIKFKNSDLLTQAFVHRSYLNENKQIAASNERLEFLGDAVLSFLTSHYLYQSYPEYPEGTLTNIRSSLVKTQSLAQVAQTLSLGELLLLSRGEEASGGRTNSSLLADAFEALLGAIFLDQGIEACQKFLTVYLFPKTRQIVEMKTYLDYKSLLQEVIQEDLRISPAYRLVKSEGPDHAKTFWMEVLVGDRVLGQGKGRSKQEAEQAAAQSALEKIQEK